MGKNFAIVALLLVVIVGGYGSYRWWDWWIRGIARQEAIAECNNRDTFTHDWLDRTRGRVGELERRIGTPTQEIQLLRQRVNELERELENLTPEAPHDP